MLDVSSDFGGNIYIIRIVCSTLVLWFSEFMYNFTAISALFVGRMLKKSSYNPQDGSSKE